MTTDEPNPETTVPTPSSSEDQTALLMQWQTLDALWRSVLSMEASIDMSRMTVNGLVSELESTFRQSLSLEEKQHASQADVGQWTQAKSRVHYAIPKAREFIHRATWAATLPERKQIGEIVKTHLEPRVPLPDWEKVREAMEHLLKARQILFAQGNAVSQEGRALVSETQRALSTLRRNATDNARRKRDSKRR